MIRTSPITLTGLGGVPTSTTLTVGPTTSDLSTNRTFLSSVTNDAQTKASVVPNTAPSSGQLLLGNGGGTAYVPQSLSGSGATFSLSSGGVLTISAISLASITSSTSTALGVGTLELGDSSDTTLSRASGGQLAVEGVNVLMNGGALGTPSSGTLTNCTFPTLNQNTTGSAASLSISGQTGLITFTGIASTNRAKTVRDAADTILELGGSYTPSGTWTSLTLVTPVLGTPTSGNLANCTFPTLNQNTTGSAASLSISGQTGLLTVTGLASTNRAKTVRDAADTILELGGSYTPSGTWTSLTLVTPILGTPTSGNLSNCTALPISGLTSSTSAALGVGTLELGDASDTTLSRGGAGQLAVEGVNVIMSGGALGTPSSGTLTNCTFPTLNQNTTGSAAKLSISGQTGTMTFTGLTSTNRIKTVSDAADTILELGGSYTPSGTWTNLTLVTPALGTPSAGVLTNCSGTAASLTAGNATTLATGRNINGVSFNGSAAIVAPATTTAGRFAVVSNGGAQWEEGGTVVKASGTSASGSAGTSVAAITAAANSQIVAWYVWSAQSTAVNTQVTVTITYSDTSTTTDTTAANGNSWIQGNAGGLLRFLSGSATTLTAGSSLAVTKIEVLTAGTGVGTRYGIIAGLQVPR